MRKMKCKALPEVRIARRATAVCLLGTQLLMACASAAPPPRSIAPTGEEELKLKGGDRVRIDVWRQPEFSGEFVIGAGGELVHPLYQEVNLGGLSLPEARQRLSGFLRTYLQGAQLVVEPLASITVAGEVRAPNVYYLAWGTTIAEAIGHAGGPTASAELDRVRLVRDGSEYELSLSEELTTYGSVAVVSGDQIFVARESEFNVFRDIVAPVSTLAVLVLTIVRIADRAGN